MQWREDNRYQDELVMDNFMFSKDLVDSSKKSILVDINTVRTVGMLVADLFDERLKGTSLREKLKHYVMNHDMHRPRKENYLII